MSNIYAFLAAGIIGAAVALYVWLKDEAPPEPPHRPKPNNRPPKPPGKQTSRETGDVSPPRYFESGSDCIIGCGGPSTIKFVPCLHTCMCENCFAVYLKYDNKCPLCRFQIEDHFVVDPK